MVAFFPYAPDTEKEHSLPFPSIRFELFAIDIWDMPGILLQVICVDVDLVHNSELYLSMKPQNLLEIYYQSRSTIFIQY